MAHSRSTSTRASSRLPQQAQKLPDHVVQRLKSMCSKDPFNCIVAVKRVQLPWRSHASPSVCDNSRSAIPLSSSSDPIHLAVYKNYPRKISNVSKEKRSLSCASSSILPSYTQPTSGKSHRTSPKQPMNRVRLSAKRRSSSNDTPSQPLKMKLKRIGRASKPSENSLTDLKVLQPTKKNMNFVAKLQNSKTINHESNNDEASTWIVISSSDEAGDGDSSWETTKHRNPSEDFTLRITTSESSLSSFPEDPSSAYSLTDTGLPNIIQDSVFNGTSLQPPTTSSSEDEYKDERPPSCKKLKTPDVSSHCMNHFKSPPSTSPPISEGPVRRGFWAIDPVTKKYREVERIVRHKNIERNDKVPRAFLVVWIDGEPNEQAWLTSSDITTPSLIERYLSNVKWSTSLSSKRGRTKRPQDSSTSSEISSNSSRSSTMYSPLFSSNSSSSSSHRDTLSSPKSDSFVHIKLTPNTRKVNSKCSPATPQDITRLPLLSNNHIKTPRRITKRIKVALTDGENGKNNTLPTNPSSTFDKPNGTGYSSAQYQKSLRLAEEKINKNITEPYINIENFFDELPFPTEFNYISSNIAGKNTYQLDDTAITGCSCKTCGKSSSCCTQTLNSECPYTKTGKIRVAPGSPVYECNAACFCGPDCMNRVVQRGRQIPVTIFRTVDGRGWGVKCLERIKKGTFVTEYVGEIITSEEAERRGKTYDKAGSTYLFDLDFVEEMAVFTIDATKYGNVSHFLNHSCNPNLHVFSVWIETLDARLPHLALFAKRSIEAGEELTFDYQMGHNLESSNKERIPCLCGSDMCSGYLF